MGEGTPEAIEIQCPGCESRFRLTPKKGRLPSGDIPCPKCTEVIPVKEGKVVENDSSGDGESADKARSTSLPGFGVMTPTRKAKVPASDSGPTTDDAEEEDDPIARLERMAGDLPAGSTMAGLPGVGSFRDGSANPFQTSRTSDKTSEVDPSLLEKVATDGSDPEERSSGEDGSSPSKSGQEASFLPADKQPQTSPRLMSGEMVGRLADESSSAVIGTDDLPEQDRPRRLKQGSEPSPPKKEAPAKNTLRETAENKSVASQLRETAENKRVASGLDRASKSGAEARRTQIGRPVTSGGDDAPTREIKKDSILGKIKTTKKLVDPNTKDDTGSASQPADSQTALSPLERLKKLKKRKAAGSEKDESGGVSTSGADADGGSLAKLFKEVQKKRGTDSGQLKAKLKTNKKKSASSLEGDSPVVDEGAADADLPIAKEVEISEGEIASIVDRSSGADDDDAPPPTADAPGEEAFDDAPALPIPKATSTGDGDHGDLFADVDTPESKGAAESGAIGVVSRKRGKTTTQSMLARLQKQKKSHDDSVEAGAAGEKRGSGYIRLPTAEIQEVLGQGDFRLKIEGIIYEPVDKDGLIRLIKGGVLLGAEELAEGNGDWMPVSEHPVFGELRRKMASEAHHVLSRLGLQKKKVDDTEDAPASPSADLPARAKIDPEFSPEPPTTKELDTSQQEKLRVGMTDKQFVVDAGEIDGDPKESSQSGDEEIHIRDAAPEAAAVDEPQADEVSTEEVASPLEDEAEDADTRADSAEQAPPKAQATADLPSPDPGPSAAPKTQAESPSEPKEPAPPQAEAAPPDDELESFGDQEFIDAEQASEPSIDRKKSKLPLLMALLMIVAIAAAGGLFLTDQGQELMEQFTGESAEEPSQETDHADAVVDPELAEALSQSSQRLVGARNDARQTADAIANDPSEPGADAWIQQRLEQDAYADVVDLMTMQWNEGRRDSDFLNNYARALIESGAYRRARRVALVGLREAPDDDFTALHRRAITEDERLTSYDFVALEDPTEFTARGVYEQSNHRGLILENRDKFDGTLIFKPELPGRQNNWRVEIAAWRFCELVVCHFEIFEVQPAVMTREFVDALGGDTEGFDQLTGQINWASSEDQPEDAVRGSLEYIPDAEAVPFPLGGPGPWLRDWRRLVAAGGASAQVLEQPVEENLAALEGVLDAQHYDELLEVMQGQTTSDLARQISALITFDFLFNNPDRIARINAPGSGINKPFVDSTMIARHNGDAFSHLRISRRVEDRFGWTTRHSRSTVASIRALDREILAEVLFPEPTASETQLVDAIWQQRNALRDRIDDLIRRHDEDEVLHFP